MKISQSIMEQEQFYAALNHDLKNSIQAQTKSLSMLSKGVLGSLNPAQQEIIDLIYESSLNMQEILFSSLNLYKFENGFVQLNKNVFDIQELIKSCIKECEIFAKECKLSIVFNSELNDKNCNVCADKIQLRSVISNLLSNSVKYSLESSDIKVNLFASEGVISFSCENIGKEIPAIIKDHIFEKHIPKTSNPEVLSSGLGLYLSKMIMEAHNGKIYLTTSGNVNKFTIEIASASI